MDIAATKASVIEEIRGRRGDEISDGGAVVVIDSLIINEIDIAFDEHLTRVSGTRRRLRQRRSMITNYVKCFICDMPRQIGRAHV